MRDAVRYFELTANQLTALTGIDASWLEYRASATERADRIAVEIEQETRRVTLDPAALGQRYVALETICRQSQARRLRSVADARAVLTPAQAREACRSRAGSCVDANCSIGAECQLAVRSRDGASCGNARRHTRRRVRLRAESRRAPARLPRIIAVGAPGSEPERLQQACQALTEGRRGSVMEKSRLLAGSLMAVTCVLTGCGRPVTETPGPAAQRKLARVAALQEHLQEPSVAARQRTLRQWQQSQRARPAANPFDQPQDALTHFLAERLPEGRTEIGPSDYLGALQQAAQMPVFSTVDNRFIGANPQGHGCSAWHRPPPRALAVPGRRWGPAISAAARARS